MAKMGHITMRVNVQLTLWSAIKLAIAGIKFPKNKAKVTIQELIDAERGCKLA